MIDRSRVACWICGSSPLDPFKPSNLPASVEPADFRITDSHYGRTGALSRCPACGFIQTTEEFEALGFYQRMDDQGYEETRDERSLQFRRLLERVKRLKPAGRLLDIGAGSGALVEEAQRLGFQARGVEPSGLLSERAKTRSLPVHHGVLPHAELPGPFDIVTIIDVIEHVMDPMSLIAEAAKVLEADGLIVVVTPDVSSLAARTLGPKWWHFRVAHVGYFNQANLDLAFEKQGFVRIEGYRPSWHFPVHYLVERVKRYVPLPKAFKLPAALGDRTIRLNLGDSIAAVYRRRA